MSKIIPKNILIITDSISSGGSTTFMNGLINELIMKTTNQVTLISFCESKNLPLVNNLKTLRLNHLFIPINNGHSIRSLPSRIQKIIILLSQIKNQKFDFVFTDLIYPTFSFQIARLLYPNFRATKIFHHIHGSFSEELKSQELQDKKLTSCQAIKFKLFHLIEKTTLMHCQKIFVYSQYSKKLTKKLHGQLPVYINKPGIDPAFESKVRHLNKSRSKQTIGLNPKYHYVLFTSRIEPRKGVTDFFANIQNFKFSPNIVFIVCTHFIESKFLYDFLKKIDNTGLGSKILLINTPSRKQLSLLYRAVDLTVMPSTRLETFGFSTLESYYYQTPVVAFNIGANPELIPQSHLINYSSKNRWKKLYQRINYMLNHSVTINYSNYNYSWKSYVNQILS